MRHILVCLELPPGFRPAYRSGTHCGGCGGNHWWIGRLSAECAVCGYTLPLARRTQPSWLTPSDAIAVG